MASLKSIVEKNDNPWGRRFDFIVQFLIVVSIITFSLETLPDLEPWQAEALWVIEIACVIFFTIEYILRIVVADKPFRFIFSFFGLVDLLAILPFYLTVGLDLRTVRMFRLLRLFRLLKFMRYSSALDRFIRAFKIAKDEIIVFTMVTMIMIFLSAVGIYYFEHEAQPEKFRSVIDSLWWAVSTLTAVGYGDVYPITAGGKVFTFVVLLVGLGIVSVPAGLIASAFSKIRREDEELKKKEKKKHKGEKHH